MKKIYIAAIYFFFLFIFGLSIIRIGSFIAVSQYGITNEIIVSCTKGIDVSVLQEDDVKGSEENLYTKWMNITKMLESFCTTSYPLVSEMKDITELVQKELLHSNLSDNLGFYGMLETGTKAAENLNTFLVWLKENDTNYLYINTPYIDNVRYLRNQKEDVINWNIVYGAEIFWEKLSIQNDRCFRIYDALNDNYTFRYDSSNHWMTENVLDACKIIADKINELYKFDIPKDVFELRNYYNIVEDNKEFYEKIQETNGYDMNYFVPYHEGSYTMIIGKNVSEGTWQEVFVATEDKWTSDELAYHEITNIKNLNGVYYLRNNELNTGKKLVIIGDSYTWPVYSYMAQVFDEVYAIWNWNKVDYCKIVQEQNPDVVIVMLNDCQFATQNADENFMFKKIEGEE